MSEPASARGEGFYVVAREPGAEHPALPTWANELPNPVALAAAPKRAAEWRPVDAVPGAFQILDLLSAAECRRLIELTEALGYLPDAAVSLPRAIRHNHNLTWVADTTTTDLMWLRCADLLAEHCQPVGERRALGLNARFRFYRYQPGDYFKPHTDGAWPGSAVLDHELITNAYPDRWSQYSFLVFLSDGYTGGRTEFYLAAHDPQQPARGGQAAVVASVQTPAGGALCFPHGQHPLHCTHSSEAIASGTKYIIRTDVLFEIEPGH